jgi:hypothetical protein
LSLSLGFPSIICYHSTPTAKKNVRHVSLTISNAKCQNPNNKRNLNSKYQNSIFEI